jgi:hypothetical protein
MYLTLLGFEFRTSHLMGKCSTTWATFQPFLYLVIFQVGSKVFAQRPTSDLTLPPMWVKSNMDHHTQLINWDRGLTNFLSMLASNYNPPDLCLLNSWNYRCNLYRCNLHPAWILNLKPMTYPKTEVVSSSWTGIDIGASGQCGGRRGSVFK